MPNVKSPSYFYCHGLPPSHDRVQERVTSNYFVPDTATYEALFDGVHGEKAVGEVSPAYLASVRAIQHIAQELPKTRIIVILRNPVERFYARYVGRHRDGLETHAGVGDLLDHERRQPLIIDEAVGTYLSTGFVSHFLEAYLQYFPSEQLCLTFFDDLKADGPAYMRQLFEFLEVDPAFKPDMSERLNKSGGAIRNPILRGIWTKSAMLRASIRPNIPKSIRDGIFRQVTRNVVASSLDPETRLQLIEIYRHEIETLQTMTGRDLTHWLGEAA